MITSEMQREHLSLQRAHLNTSDMHRIHTWVCLGTNINNLTCRGQAHLNISHMQRARLNMRSHAGGAAEVQEAHLNTSESA